MSVVNLESPVYVLDPTASEAFITILDEIIVSCTSEELVSRLAKRDRETPGHYLSGYYLWGIVGQRFWLKQRIAYRSIQLFDDCILTVLFGQPGNENEI